MLTSTGYNVSTSGAHEHAKGCNFKDQVQRAELLLRSSEYTRAAGVSRLVILATECFRRTSVVTTSRTQQEEVKRSTRPYRVSLLKITLRQH